MMCPACVSNVKASLSTVNGVKDSSIYLKSGTAEVTTEDSIKPESLCDAVKKVSYGCNIAK